MKLLKIAQILNCSISEETGKKEISRITSLELADEESISFLSDNKQSHIAILSNAAAIIVKKGKHLEGKVTLEVEDPYLGCAKVARIFEDVSPLFDGPVHQTAIIHSSANIHPSVYIGPASVIGKDCVIGEKTIIGAHCVIENNSRIGKECHIDSGVIIRRNTVIGNRVIIQSGTVIGSEGFGNAMEGDKFVRIPSFGNVVIEDGVEIGANVTIDRGSFGPTVICKGAKLDNLIQIAHNVVVGENSAMAAQVGISGSTKIGRNVLFGGQAGLAGHLEIGDYAFIGAKAGVSKNVKSNAKVTGYPARDFMKMRRIEAAQLSLPEMTKKLKALSKEIELLKKDRE